MPEEDNKKVIPARMHEENSQEMSILLQKVLGSDSTPNFTKEQIDELLSQKRESKDGRFYLVVVLLFILAFSLLVLWKRPDLFNEVLSFLAGLFGGGLGGYGLASKKSS